MKTRQIISIDKEKCNGCGNCVTGCQEGALQIVDGKAELVKEEFCDGFGDCIGECPTGALTIEERPAEEFDLQAAAEHVTEIRGEAAAKKMVAEQQHQAGGCPGMRMEVIENEEKKADQQETTVESKLGQWPVQIDLLSPTAPYFSEADLLITADCVPVAYGDYHQGLLAGKAVAMGCPKLDKGSKYVEKLAAIIKNNDLASITIARMEVPCCSGLTRIVNQALTKAGSSLEPQIVTIGIEGKKK